MSKKVLVICSGGMDSFTLSHQVYNDPDYTLVGLLSFDYGQRHKKELQYAKQCAKTLGVAWKCVDISGLGQLLKSALTYDQEVPQGAYNQDNMHATVVPNRNAIMLSIAYGIASSMGVDMVGIAVHGGDHFIYPDCRPEFLDAFHHMQQLALDGLQQPVLYAPYTHMCKSDIATIAKSLDLDMVQSWSCYNGDDIHCGACGTCVERKQAIKDSGVKDSTTYAV